MSDANPDPNGEILRDFMQMGSSISSVTDRIERLEQAMLVVVSPSEFLSDHERAKMMMAQIETEMGAIAREATAASRMAGELRGGFL